MVVLPARAWRAILVRFLGHRHGIDAAEPAMQVDVGTAPAAERPQLLHRAPSADRAGAGMRRFARLIHLAEMVMWAAVIKRR